MNKLIVTQHKSGNAAERAVAVIAKSNVPPPVIRAIASLILAYPAGMPKDDESQEIVMGNFYDAIHGFPQPVVMKVLSDLRFNNPNNPFPPTIMDVRTACKDVVAKAIFAARRYYFEGELWAEEHGPCPEDPGFWGSKDALMESLRTDLRHRLRYGHVEHSTLFRLTDSQFDRIPNEAFDEEYSKDFVRRNREEIRQRREADRIKAEERLKQKQFVESIDDEELRVACEEIRIDRIRRGYKALSDDELVEYARDDIKRNREFEEYRRQKREELEEIIADLDIEMKRACRFVVQQSGGVFESSKEQLIEAAKARIESERGMSRPSNLRSSSIVAHAS